MDEKTETERTAFRSVAALSALAARASALYCLLQALPATPMSSVEPADVIGIIAAVCAVVFRGERTVAPLFVAIVALGAVWSTLPDGRALEESIGFGVTGLLLVTCAASIETTWGTKFGAARPLARTAAIWGAGVVAAVVALVLTMQLVLPDGALLAEAGVDVGSQGMQAPPLQDEAAVCLAIGVVAVAAMLIVPALFRHTRDTTLGPDDGRICHVAEPAVVGTVVGFLAGTLAANTGYGNAAFFGGIIAGWLAWVGLLPLAKPSARDRVVLPLAALATLALFALASAMLVRSPFALRTVVGAAITTAFATLALRAARRRVRRSRWTPDESQAAR